MVNTLKTKARRIVKFFKLLFQIVKTESNLYVSIFLLILVLAPLTNISKDVRINLIASLFVTIPIFLFQLGSKFMKFSRLEGVYDSYLYDEKDKEKLNTAVPIGVYKVQYDGGYKISIKKSKSLRVGWEKHLWEGKAEIPDVEIGTLYWQYTSPPNYENFVGYKRIVIPETKSRVIKIYMFGEGQMFTPREVLIKRSSN